MFDRVTVRMYEMGFGDCFLVTFWKEKIGKSVLFDCGSLSRTKAEISKVAADVVASCMGDDGKPRIELVVCTHRHKDHVNGFDDAVWAKVEVGEVWMPWTENPRDAEATRIRERQSSFAFALCKSLDANFKPSDMPLADGRNDEVAARLALALNALSLTNEKAMATLHDGFAGRPPRYFLPLKDSVAEVRTVAGLPGVTFHILGPSRSESVIKSMNPPAGGAYLANLGGAGSNPPRPKPACETKWQISQPEFETLTRGMSTFTAKDREEVNKAADEPDGDLAAAIDQAVNNTSLVTMIEVGGQFLLFPGDAQWGTWKAILDDADGRRLLEHTTMLKVSHHGSHNGTPKELVEKLLQKGTVALVSTEPVKQWPDVPRAPLMKALAAQAILARSDKATKVKGQAGFTVEESYVVWETLVPS